MQPQSEGGSDTIENIVLLCADCHLRHHQRKLALPPFDGLEPDESFRCHVCDNALNIETVTMNCGWYRCEQCDQTVHLWAHCGFDVLPDYESSTR